MDHIARARAEWDRADKLKEEAASKAEEADAHYWATAKHLAAAVDGGLSYAEVAEQVGRSRRRVNDAVLTWRRFPEGRRLAGRNFWEHVDVASHTADAPEILKRAEQAPDRSLKSIRYEIDAEKKARAPEAIKEAVKANPEAARALIDDPDAFRQIRRAESVKHQEEEEGFRKRVPEFHNLEAFDAVERALDRMLRTLDEAIREVSRAPGNKKLFALVDRKLVAAEGKLDMLRAVLNAGPVDEELQKILDGGA